MDLRGLLLREWKERVGNGSMGRKRTGEEGNERKGKRTYGVGSHPMAEILNPDCRTDLIGGVATFAPGGKHPLAITVKTYTCTPKIKFLGQGFQKLEHDEDRQTDA